MDDTHSPPLGSRGGFTPPTSGGDGASSVGTRSSSEKKSLTFSPGQMAQVGQLLPALQASSRSQRSEPAFSSTRSERLWDSKSKFTMPRDVQKQLILEQEERNLTGAALHKDTQKRLDEVREKIGRVEVQLQEAVSRMEARLRARDEDLAELREELRSGRPTMPAWTPEEQKRLLSAMQATEEATAGGAGCSGSTPEEVGPSFSTLAADFAELRRSLTVELQEQSRQQTEASSNFTVQLNVIGEQMQEQQSENIVLRRRVSCVEADVREALGALRTVQDEDLLDQASTGSSRGPARKQRRHEVMLNSLQSLESVEEASEAEEFATQSPVELDHPRLSIMPDSVDESDGTMAVRTTGSLLGLPETPGATAQKVRRGSMPDLSAPSGDRSQPVVHSHTTGDFDTAHRERGTSSSSAAPVVRRNASDLAEVMRQRRERCQEWVSKPEAEPEAPPPMTPINSAPPTPTVQSKKSWDVIECSDATTTQLVERMQLLEDRLDGVQLLEGKVEAEGQRIEQKVETVQYSLIMEIAEVRQLVEALPASDSKEAQSQVKLTEFQRVAAESAAMAARLVALERRADASETFLRKEQEEQQALVAQLRNRMDSWVAEDSVRAGHLDDLRDRIDSLATEVARQPSSDQAPLAAEARVLTGHVRTLEARLEDCLHELQSGRAVELAALSQGNHEAEGPKNPSREQLTPGAKPRKASGTPEKGEKKEEDIDTHIEELGRRLKSSDSRIEELMKKMLSESEEAHAQVSELQEEEVSPQPVACESDLHLEARGLDVLCTDTSESLEMRKALEELQIELAAEARGLREKLEAHAECHDEQIRSLQQEHMSGATSLTRQLETVASAGRRGEAFVEAMLGRHSEEASRQQQALHEEQQRLAMQAGALQLRIDAFLAERAAAGEDTSTPKMEAPDDASPGGDDTRPAAEAQLSVLREKVEVLAGEQGKHAARVDEHQEALEGLQGQVGVLETCLEENDGKLSEMQTTLMKARLEGLVAMDDQIKSIESQVKANDKMLSEAQVGELTHRSTQHDERLSALERSIEDVRRRVDSTEEVLTPGSRSAGGRQRASGSPAATVTPRLPDSNPTSSRQSQEGIVLNIPTVPVAAAARREDGTNICVWNEQVQDLRRYVDDRLRRVQRTQQDEAAELRRRLDACARLGATSMPRPVAEAAGDFPPGSSLDVRVQELEGKCSTMLGLLLQL